MWNPHPRSLCKGKLLSYPPSTKNGVQNSGLFGMGGSIY